jgi:pimeloyl-ACP methyl ester carboxylesterase
MEFRAHVSKPSFFRSKDGTVLSYQQSGAGPPLLLIHGTGADSTRWRPVLGLFEERYTVFAPDRRGYGRSGDAPAYGLEREFDDIAALIEAIDRGPADVIAHSYGAICALGAATAGARLRRLVAYEPPLPVRAEDYFPRDLPGAMSEFLTRGDRARAVEAFLSGVLDLDPEELAAMQRLNSWSALLDRAAIVQRELQAVERLTGNPQAFRTCRTPTLLMLGGESPPQYRATAQALHAAIAGSRIAVLAGQGHAAINAAPTLFAKEAIAFLSEA